MKSIACNPFAAVSSQHMMTLCCSVITTHDDIEMLACPMIWFLSQRPLTWFLRSVLVLPSFVGIMLPRAQTEDNLFTAYEFCVKASAPCQLLDPLSYARSAICQCHKDLSMRIEAKLQKWMIALWLAACSVMCRSLGAGSCSVQQM